MDNVAFVWLSGYNMACFVRKEFFGVCVCVGGKDVEKYVRNIDWVKYDYIMTLIILNYFKSVD